MRNPRPEPVLAAELKSLGVLATPALELFDQLPDTLFWIKDARCRFRWVNMALMLLNGRTSRWDLLGRTDSDFDELSRVNQFYHDDAKALVGQVNRNRIMRNLIRQTIKDNKEKADEQQ